MKWKIISKYETIRGSDSCRPAEDDLRRARREKYDSDNLFSRCRNSKLATIAVDNFVTGSVHLPGNFLTYVLKSMAWCQLFSHDVAGQNVFAFWRKTHLVKHLSLLHFAFRHWEAEGSNCTPLGVHRIAEKIGAGEPAGTVFKSRQVVGHVSQPEFADAKITTRICGWKDSNPASIAAATWIRTPATFTSTALRTKNHRPARVVRLHSSGRRGFDSALRFAAGRHAGLDFGKMKWWGERPRGFPISVIRPARGDCSPHRVHLRLPFPVEGFSICHCVRPAWQNVS